MAHGQRNRLRMYWSWVQLPLVDMLCPNLRDIVYDVQKIFLQTMQKIEIFNIFYKKLKKIVC